MVDTYPHLRIVSKITSYTLYPYFRSDECNKTRKTKVTVPPLTTTETLSKYLIPNMGKKYDKMKFVTVLLIYIAF